MPEQRLIVSRSAVLEQHAPGGALAFADLVVEAWPRQEKPLVQQLTLVSELLTMLRSPSLRDGTDDAVGILVCWHGSEPMGRVAEVADHLLRHNVPAIFAVQRYDESWTRFEAQGLIVEAMETLPAHFARVLHATMLQSDVIFRLEQDVRAAHATHGGISGQISRLHEEMNLAAVIQRDLMPATAPVVEGLDIGVIFRPAAYVSGDIFDLVELDDGRVAFLLADAMGHGVPAALLTMLIHRAVTEQRLRDGASNASPASTMNAINSALNAACPRGQRFATAVYGIIDPRTYEVSLTVAGHPPPLRFCGHASHSIHGHGPLLGVFEDAEFGEEKFTLQPGETLLLYSDGFETAFPSGVQGESPANSQYLRHFQAFGPECMNEGGVRSAMLNLERLLDSQSGSLHQGDDITAIALARPRQQFSAAA
jgi:phosphoserine phosphatase RsbU/P